MPSPSPTPDETPHYLVGAFYDVENFPTAKLLLNNKDIVAREVRPTLYSLDGQAMEIAPVTVEANSFRMINLNDWASLGGANFRRGSIKLFHTGKDLNIGTQIYLSDEAASLSFEERLTELGKFDSRRLEAIWGMPLNQTQARVILSNTTDTLLEVTAKLSRAPNVVGAPQTFSLLPHQTRVLNLRQDFNDGETFANSNVVGLTLEHTGEKSALKAHGQIRHVESGYSNIISFSNPNGGKSNELHGAGLHVGTMGNEQVAPFVILKNVGTTTATVQSRVPYTRNNGTTGTVNLNSVNLQPGEIKILNTTAVVERSQQENIKIAGLEIRHNITPGSILVNAQSVSPSRTQVYRVPMADPLAQTSSTGGYPWRIEETSKTISYIKNMTDLEQEYIASLRWENGGEYMIGLKKIAPNKTIEIDVKKIRDEQTPDFRGRTIPLNITSGQIQWTLRQTYNTNIPQNDKFALIGRSEHIDVANGISSSYACQNCCSGGFVGARITTDPSGFNEYLQYSFQAGETAQFYSFIEIINCYNQFEICPYPTTTWHSNNPSVALVSTNGLTTIIGSGDAIIDIGEIQGTLYLESYSCNPFVEEICDDKSAKEISKEETNNIIGCGQCDSVTNSDSPTANISAFNPQVTIAPIDWVEKNGLKSTTVRVEQAQSNTTTIFSLRMTNNTTGSATFENGSTQVSFMGNVNDQELKIKGVTESSQIDNIIIEAKIGNTVKASDNFTVVAITALEFERINTGGTNPDVALDNNPGNGQQNTNVGQRIFPDKNTPNDMTDRAILRVKATVAPANIPNLKVYFASFDLDDPSANASPIDTNASDGVDNNGNVNNSKSGEFSNADGVTCANATTGSAPLHVSKIECPVTNNTTAANFKVTMQPGDNFAIAASLDSTYRNEIKVNTNAGTNLINNANQIIPISGEANSNNVRGIRTNMLTVWRRLNIEIDSMGNVSDNNETGNFSSTQTIVTGNTTLNVTVANPLEPNRFENGRLVIDGIGSFQVIDHTTSPAVTANTANSVTINNPGIPVVITRRDTFTLYDDDDFNNNDGTNKVGDDNEDVSNPDTASLTNGSDNPTDNVFARAYVRIVHVTTLDTTDDAIFRLNTLSDNASDLRPLFTPGLNLPTSTNIDNAFWAVYLLGSYQHTLLRDNDPNDEESAIRGIVDEITLVTGDLEGSGALIFKEVIRTSEIDDPSIYNIERNIVAHEVGHLFSGEHTPDGGLMGAPISSNQFSDITLNKIRRIMHP